MTVEKISISLPADRLAEYRRLAKANGETLSAFFARAAERQSKLLGLRELIDEDIAKIDPEEWAAAQEYVRRQWEELEFEEE